MHVVFRTIGFSGKIADSRDVKTAAVLRVGGLGDAAVFVAFPFDFGLDRQPVEGHFWGMGGGAHAQAEAGEQEEDVELSVPGIGGLAGVGRRS